MLNPLEPLWTLVCLTWWKWALRHLTRKDACHQDLPRIVLRIRELEA